MSLNEYFKHMILLADKRCIKDSRFIYQASNTLLRRQCLDKGRLFVRKNSGLENLTGEEIKQRLLQYPNLYRQLMCWNSTVRSTPSYWYARSKELESMVKQLKPATLFFTLSAADIHWPELYR